MGVHRSEHNSGHVLRGTGAGIRQNTRRERRRRRASFRVTFWPLSIIPRSWKALSATESLTFAKSSAFRKGRPLGSCFWIAPLTAPAPADHAFWWSVRIAPDHRKTTAARSAPTWRHSIASSMKLRASLSATLAASLISVDTRHRHGTDGDSLMWWVLRR